MVSLSFSTALIFCGSLGLIKYAEYLHSNYQFLNDPLTPKELLDNQDTEGIKMRLLYELTLSFAAMTFFGFVNLILAVLANKYCFQTLLVVKDIVSIFQRIIKKKTKTKQK